MSVPHRIRTRRLELTPLTLSDGAALHALWTEESVREFLWDGETISRERTRKLLGENEERFERLGYGLWGVRRKTKAAPLIGFAGYWPFHDPPEWQLVYGFAPEGRGAGYAAETVRALIRHGFEELGFQRIVASADAPNEASVAVMKAAGMSFERRLEVLGRDTVYYSIHLRP